MRLTLPTIALSVGLLIFSLFVTDCSCGYTSYKQGQVIGKYYVPPETHVSVDSDGDVSVDTDPEEWHVVFAVSGDDQADIETRKSFHDFFQIGDRSPIGIRRGRWTGFPYVKSIALGATLDANLSMEK